jgi:hypothetical protein
MSDTPRTDALIYRKTTIEMQRHELLDFALALERELAEAREELNDRRKFAYAVEQALDGVKGDYVEIIEELRKDAERYQWLRGLDWINGGLIKIFWSVEETEQMLDKELDAAIDAAMKECGK